MLYVLWERRFYRIRINVVGCLPLRNLSNGRFRAGLELGEQFYSEAAKPIIDTYFPGLRYSAAMLGWSSEVLGYDDVESMDHNWVPASAVFITTGL